MLFNIQQSTLIQNDIDFSDDLQSTLKSAQRQISSISSKEDFAFAYISLFQLLEIISRHFIVETNNGWNLPMYNYDYYGNAGNAITKTETKNPPILSKLIAIYEMNNVQAHNNHFLVKKIDDCIRRRHSFVHHLKELHIAKNKTIFAKEGIKSLWEIVNKIIKSVI